MPARRYQSPGREDLPSKHAIAICVRPSAFAVSRVPRRKADPLRGNRGRDHRPSRQPCLAGCGNEIRKSLEYAPPAGLETRTCRRWRAPSHASSSATCSNPELLQTDAEAAYNGDPAASSKDEVIVGIRSSKPSRCSGWRTSFYLDNVPLISAHHDRMGARANRPGSPSRSANRHAFLRGSRHRDRGGETAIIATTSRCTRCGSGCEVARRRADAARPETKSSHHRRPRYGLCRGHHHRGDTVIGEGSTIGASVFLTTSVPPNSLVVLEATNVKVISKKLREAGCWTIRSKTGSLRGQVCAPDGLQRGDSRPRIGIEIHARNTQKLTAPCAESRQVVAVDAADRHGGERTRAHDAAHALQPKDGVGLLLGGRGENRTDANVIRRQLSRAPLCSSLWVDSPKHLAGCRQRTRAAVRLMSS